jgi:hypothetical protein
VSHCHRHDMAVAAASEWAFALQVAELLRGLVQQRGVQVIAVTHSAAFQVYCNHVAVRQAATRSVRDC